jgi:hypothetical protein
VSALRELWGSKAAEHDDPIKIVQQALSERTESRFDAMLNAVQTIVSESRWSRGGRHDCFAAFAIAPPPDGLGLQSEAPAKFLRLALFHSGHVREWADVLHRIARPPGRPRTKFVNDEDFKRFFKVSTAANSIDRLLLQLMSNHRELFEAACRGECSVRQAGIRAGLIKDSCRRYGGSCDIEAAAMLSEKAQGGLLCSLFKKLSLTAQCTLIATVLEGRLGVGLAKQWRDGVSS